MAVLNQYFLTSPLLVILLKEDLSSLCFIRHLYCSAFHSQARLHIVNFLPDIRLFGFIAGIKSHVDGYLFSIKQHSEPHYGIMTVFLTESFPPEIILPVYFEIEVCAVKVCPGLHLGHIFPRRDE